MELPKSYIEYTHALLGKEAFQQWMSAFQEEAPVSIRLNQSKFKLPLDSSYSVVPWCTTGFYLDQRLTFTFDPLFHAGCYYVQEASSMFLEQALKQHLDNRPVVMLDLCAAPGGKSTHARSVMPEGSLLIANEVIRSRAQILVENLTKWGHPEVVVTHNDPADFSSLENFFDVLVTDVPCSGEGMFRKDPVAISEWSLENVELCQQRQRRILRDVWPALKTGGILVYSTCTYNTKENEENVQWICDELGAEILPVEVPESWKITGNLLVDKSFPVYRFLPHRTQGEGFFLTVLRKKGETQELSTGGKTLNEVMSCNAKSVDRKKKGGQAKNTTPTISKEQIALAKSWLQTPESYELVVNGTLLTALSAKIAAYLPILKRTLHILQAGIQLGELKGKDLLPSHALALSQVLRPDAFIRVEITYEQAIAYLRKESISLSDTTPRGVILLTYKETPLGFVKNVGNRANNLYPQEWRIRSGYLPAEVRTL